MIKYIEDNLNEELKKYENCIVDFFANWCMPCKMLSEILNEIESENEINLLKVDVDKNVKIAEEYMIDAIPVLMFFKNGKLEHKIEGYVEKEQLLKKINEIFN